MSVTQNKMIINPSTFVGKDVKFSKPRDISIKITKENRTPINWTSVQLSHKVEGTKLLLATPEKCMCFGFKKEGDKEKDISLSIYLQPQTDKTPEGEGFVNVMNTIINASRAYLNKPEIQDQLNYPNFDEKIPSLDKAIKYAKERVKVEGRLIERIKENASPVVRPKLICNRYSDEVTTLVYDNTNKFFTKSEILQKIKDEERFLVTGIISVESIFIGKNNMITLQLKAQELLIVPLKGKIQQLLTIPAQTENEEESESQDSLNLNDENFPQM